MKKWAAFLFFVLSVIFTTKWLTDYRAYEQSETAQNKNDQWQGHVKKTAQSKPVQLKDISKQDRKFLPSSPQKIKRRPSSLPPQMSSRPRKKMIGKQDVLEQELMLINDPRSDWQEIFVERMLNTQAPNTKMFVQHKGQAYIVRNTKARAVEEVLVTFKREDESVSSYMAWVDSETGSLIKTWAQTHNHNFREKASGLTPSGSL